MKIKNILDKIEYIKHSADEEIEVYSITNDSREIENNGIFVAVSGYKKDGNSFVDKALEDGAKLIITEEERFLDRNIPVIQVKDSRVALSKISNILNNKPSKKINLIGVTGTNGKTSITYILDHIFRYSGNKTGIIGTMGAVINGEKINLNNTTPESHQIHNFLSEMVRVNTNSCFMEVSSHATVLKRVEDLDFNIGIFTNLTKDHLDFHKNMEEYYKAKKKLFYKSGISIINLDDEYGKKMYDELKQENRKVFGYSIDNSSDFKAEIKKTSIEGTIFNLTYNNTNIKIEINTPGRFSVYNTLASIIAAKLSGIEIENIKKSLKNLKGIVGRFEIVPTTLNCTVILDFAHTPDGLEKIMETIDEVAIGRKVVMFGAGGERDVSRRSLMGEVAGKYCDFCYITSDNPRYEDPESICKEIAEGVKKYHDKYKTIINREEAIKYIIDNYQKDDIILFAGKSTEPYQVIEDKKVPYNERQIALKAIRLKEKNK